MRYTNRLCLPRPLVLAVIDMDSKERNYDISVTEIIGSPKRYWLRRRHWDNIVVDVADRLFSLWGRAMHSILEKYAPHAITEERLIVDVGGHTLGGQPDLFTEDYIQDWKTTSVWSVQYESGREEHKLQLNCYRWLLYKLGFDKINLLQNVYLLRDWHKSAADREKSYPPEGVDVQPQDTMPIPQIEAFIKTRVKDFMSFENVPDDDIPPCSKEDRWVKGEQWALMKEGRKTALKVCFSKEEAEKLLKEGFKGADKIDYRPGEDKKCTQYCDCNKFCNHWKSLQCQPESQG